MGRIYPKNYTKENKKIENIIKDGLIKTDKNSYGYMIDVKSIAEVNKMDYSLWFIDGDIMYESIKTEKNKIYIGEF